MIDKNLYKNGRIQARTGYAGEQYSGGNVSKKSPSTNFNVSGGGGGKDASTTSFDKSINPNRPGGPIGRDDSGVPGPDRSKVSQFSQYGKNVFARNLDPTLKFDPRTGGMKKSFGAGLGSLFGTLLGLITGNPLISLAMGGFDRIKNFNQKLQGSDFGRSDNLMDFLDARKYGGYDEREEARKKTMDESGLLTESLALSTDPRERRIMGLPAISVDKFTGNVVPFNANTFDDTTGSSNKSIESGGTILEDEFDSTPPPVKDDNVPLPPNLLDLGNPNLLVADATTFPTFDNSGISLMKRSILRNAGYNDNQIKEAFEKGYGDQLIRDVQGPIPGYKIG